MIATMPKKKPNGRQQRFRPFKADNLRLWAEHLRDLANEMEDTLKVAQAKKVDQIRVDGGSVFDSRIDDLQKVVGKASGFVRGTVKKD